MSSGSVLARGLSDAEDRLISADEPLAGLQTRCGGELPGTIAVPSLLEAARKSRVYSLRLARAISAQDAAELVTAWVEVAPRPDGEPGCEIVVRNWRAVPLPAEEGVAIDARRAEIDRELAELVVQLDGDQRVLAVEGEAPDLQRIAAEMAAGMGRPWTEFVTVAGGSHRQPMHWRLLDKVDVSVLGSARTWRAHLYPHGAPGQEPSSFELCLTSDEPCAASAPTTAPAPARPGTDGLLGRDIAPVLRQPIARIITNAETIRTRLAGPLADEYANYAGDIASAGQHLLALVDDLADLAVVEAEDFATAPDKIDLAEVARRAASILGVRARESGIGLRAPATNETLPAVAEFRRALQVLLNLVGNAIRYSPAGSNVGLRLESAGDRARVIVADEGPGLNADQQDRVFDKFERLGRSGDGGSGLGLYISRRLARAMGGDLHVESSAGEGARFILDLPGAEAASESPGEPDDRPAENG